MSWLLVRKQEIQGGMNPDCFHPRGDPLRSTAPGGWVRRYPVISLLGVQDSCLYHHNMSIALVL
eukprot:5447947-Amphidinium_carterae.1